ncbi:hypothetical protein, partial [Mesorhizobium sp. M7A.F.Ca.CA.004.04.1.1]|uniref:hypothetical protein n=1 Tax=Mesorhizobium sp. M7A.F.Ca.CA.004.04.1.1 TaxID=2496733 RepID=UPI0019D0327C
SIAKVVPAIPAPTIATSTWAGPASEILILLPFLVATARFTISGRKYLPELNQPQATGARAW